MARKQVWNRNGFGRETGLARKLASQENWLGRETALTRKLALHGNLFLANRANIVIAILLVKQITYDAKVVGITIFLKELCR